MKTFVKAIFAIHILVNFESFASTGSPTGNADSIELKYRKCMNNSQNKILEMTNCAYNDYKDWDKELNAVYRQILLKKKLINKKKFIDAQTAWLKFRNAQFKAISNIYSRLPGNMHIPAWWGAKSMIIMNRVLELNSHLKHIKGDLSE